MAETEGWRLPLVWGEKLLTLWLPEVGEELERALAAAFPAAAAFGLHLGESSGDQAVLG